MSLVHEQPPLVTILHDMTRGEALQLWRSLPAPHARELHGEYEGHVHDGGDPSVRAAKTAFFYDSPCGFWLGKAYLPGDGGVGEGYNRFREAGGIVWRYRRFATGIGPSSLDGRPCLSMRYREFHNYAGDLDVVDEIRCLDDGAYLGIYTCTEAIYGFSTKRPGQARTEPELFALTGPAEPWVGVDDPHREVRRNADEGGPDRAGY